MPILAKFNAHFAQFLSGRKAANLAGVLFGSVVQLEVEGAWQPPSPILLSNYCVPDNLNCHVVPLSYMWGAGVHVGLLTVYDCPIKVDLYLLRPVRGLTTITEVWQMHRTRVSPSMITLMKSSGRVRARWALL